MRGSEEKSMLGEFRYWVEQLVQIGLRIEHSNIGGNFDEPDKESM